MAMSAEHRSKFEALATFPYEWKILEWDEKPKQTNIINKTANISILFPFLQRIVDLSMKWRSVNIKILYGEKQDTEDWLPPNKKEVHVLCIVPTAILSMVYNWV